MELDDALRLVAARGRLMQGLAPGSMLSVRLGMEALTGTPTGRQSGCLQWAAALCGLRADGISSPR